VDKISGGWIPPSYFLFGVVGTAGMAFNFAAAALLLQVFGLRFLEAQAIGALVTVAFNFFLNNIVTFRALRMRGGRLLMGLVGSAPSTIRTPTPAASPNGFTPTRRAWRSCCTRRPNTTPASTAAPKSPARPRALGARSIPVEPLHGASRRQKSASTRLRMRARASG
jgi:hypothetical protein